MDVRSKLDLFPSLVPTKSNRNGSALARFWSTLGDPSFPRNFCVLSLFSVSVPNFVPIFFCLVRAEGKLQLWRGCGCPAVGTLETKQQIDLGLKGIPVWNLVSLAEMAGTFFPLLLAQHPQLSLRITFCLDQNESVCSAEKSFPSCSTNKTSRIIT